MRCGVGAYTQRLVTALSELKDVGVTVLTDRRAAGSPQLREIEVLPVIDGWRMAELFGIAKLVRRLSPDVVHIQYPALGYSDKMPKLMPLLMRLLGIPCVQTWHEPVPGGGGLLLSIGLNVLITVRENLLTTVPLLTQMALRKVSLSLIPASSMLPAVALSDDERSEIRGRFLFNCEPLLVYYGFVAPLKGLEVLLEAVSKTRARLIMACDLFPSDDYHKSLLDRVSALGIAARTTITGFLPDRALSEIMAAADAVVLPFRDGAQPCNTSIDGAVAQGTFVLTTSLLHSGYDHEKNIYWAKPGDVDEMIAALDKFAGLRSACVPSDSKWRDIAARHLKIYRQVGGA